jgi:DNA-binding LacI/PurR family transcriptional regulator
VKKSASGAVGTTKKKRAQEKLSVKTDRAAELPSGERLASIKDIARAAGVHHSTVSRALHGLSIVKPETAERIQRIARDAGFTANAVARSLVTQKTWTIGVVVTLFTDPFHHEVISGLDEVAHEAGYSVILADSQADPEREVQVVRSFNERRVDAIVVMSSRVGARYMSLLSERRVPIVLINNQRRNQFAHSVLIDNVQAAFDAVRHLIDLGHTRIAYVGNQLGVYSDPERFSGYRQALAEADIPFESDLVVHGDHTPEGGERSMQKLLTLTKKPTAVFCYNDMLALGVLRALQGKVDVPTEISVVGFDDLFFAPFLCPPLTTVRQPKKEMGRLAMELVLKLLAGEETEKIIQVKGELIIRQSTGTVKR